MRIVIAFVFSVLFTNVLSSEELTGVSVELTPAVPAAPARLRGSRGPTAPTAGPTAGPPSAADIALRLLWRAFRRAADAAARLLARALRPVAAATATAATAAFAATATAATAAFAAAAPVLPGILLAAGGIFAIVLAVGARVSWRTRAERERKLARARASGREELFFPRPPCPPWNIPDLEDYPIPHYVVTADGEFRRVYP